MSTATERLELLSHAREQIRVRLPLPFTVSMEELCTQTGVPEPYLRTVFWDMLGDQTITTQQQAWVLAPALRNSHLGATPMQLAKMIGPWVNCPHCGAGPGHQERRNYDAMWGDADIYCSLCQGYVRGWDAG